MSYELDDMISKFRREMEDTVEPYLWSEDDIVDYLDQAQDEFCEKVDALTSIVEITYSATDEYVDLPNYVTRVRYAELVDGTRVALFNAEEWREDRGLSDDYGVSIHQSSWQTDTNEKVSAVITDLETDKLRLYPIPTADSSLKVHVYRRPVELLADAGEFEVKDKAQQRCILLKARALAYEKHDAETYNPRMAAEYEQRFEVRTSELASASSRSKRRARSVRYPGM